MRLCSARRSSVQQKTSVVIDMQEANRRGVKVGLTPVVAGEVEFAVEVKMVTGSRLMRT